MEEYVLQNPERRTVAEIAEALYASAGYAEISDEFVYTGGEVLGDSRDNSSLLVFLPGEEFFEYDAPVRDSTRENSLFELLYRGNFNKADRPDVVHVRVHNPLSFVTLEIVGEVQKEFNESV